MRLAKHVLPVTERYTVAMLYVCNKKYFIVCCLFLLGIVIYTGLIYLFPTETHQNTSFLYSGDVTTDSYTELKNRFIVIAQTKGASTALTMLEDESKTNDQTATFCHDILHKIGNIAYTQHETLGQAMQLKTDFCNSGYIHGLFEAYFESGTNNIHAIADICSMYATTGSGFQLWQCYHGVGHGLMYLTDGDLDKSLSLCTDVVKESSVLDCQNGVFMEVFNGEFLPHESEYVDAQNPFSVCLRYDALKSTCYMYAPIYLSENQKMPYSDILKVCDQIDSTYRDYCISGVISEATKRNMNHVSEVLSLCSNMNYAGEQEKCASSVIKMYLNQTGSIKAGHALCLSIQEKYSSVCSQIVASNEDFFKENLPQ